MRDQGRRDSIVSVGPRDFVPWRFSDAGKQRAPLKRRDAASEKPAQEPSMVTIRKSQVNYLDRRVSPIVFCFESSG
jgi:hypothetical protein